MDYFSNYNKCNNYYTIYNKNLKCAEYLFYAVNYYYHIFTLDGMYHNIKGPALIQYDKGHKYRQEYWVKNKRHNIFRDITTIMVSNITKNIGLIINRYDL